MHFHLKSERKKYKLLEIKWHFYGKHKAAPDISIQLKESERERVKETYHKTLVHKSLRARKYKVLDA